MTFEGYPDPEPLAFLLNSVFCSYNEMVDVTPEEVMTIADAERAAAESQCQNAVANLQNMFLPPVPSNQVDEQLTDNEESETESESLEVVPPASSAPPSEPSRDEVNPTPGSGVTPSAEPQPAEKTEKPEKPEKPKADKEQVRCLVTLRCLHTFRALPIHPSATYRGFKQLKSRRSRKGNLKTG